MTNEEIELLQLENNLIPYPKNEVDRLRDLLGDIASLGGNLSDDTLLSIGGVNDGKSRATMYVEARKIAREALEITK